MHRSRSIFLAVSLAVLLPVASGVLWSSVDAARDDDGRDSLYKYLAIFSEVFGLVRSNYVDAPNSDALLGGALEGVGDALDPFSALVPADATGDYERAQRLSRVRSGLVLVKDHGIVYVVSVDDGSPAATAGAGATGEQQRRHHGPQLAYQRQSDHDAEGAFGVEAHQDVITLQTQHHADKQSRHQNNQDGEHAHRVQLLHKQPRTRQ